MLYNVREMTFSDGLVRHTFYTRFRMKGVKHKLKKLGGPAMHGSGKAIERKVEENRKRAKQVVWDLGRCNSFDWFITLTFSSEQVSDRYDYKICADYVKRFTKYLGKHGCRWLIVPELHKDGAWHFHGLLSGDIGFTRAHSPYTGKELFDDEGRPIYNIDNFQYGFTTAVPLDGSPKVVTYLTKYFTKQAMAAIPKGCKRYWASRNLARPTVSYDLQSMDFFLEWSYTGADFTKFIPSQFGDFIIAEHRIIPMEEYDSDDSTKQIFSE